MEGQQTTEKQLKTVIYNIYTRFFDEPASDRRQVYIGQIWEKVILWCNNYLYINANEMGVEIFNVINRLVKDNNEAPENETEFFYILRKSLKNAKNEYHRKYEQRSIKIPLKKRQKLKEVEFSIRMKESQLGRKLNSDEQIHCVTKWFKKQEYVDLLNSINVSSISYTSNDGNGEIDVLNYADTHSVNQLAEYIIKTDMEIVRKAIKSLLNKKQERSRDCYKALLTLRCIDNVDLYPVLDRQIIEACQQNIQKPKQYEIYLKYHPEAKKSNAEATAAKMLKDFINDLETYLKEKNPEIFH